MKYTMCFLLQNDKPWDMNTQDLIPTSSLLSQSKDRFWVHKVAWDRGLIQIGLYLFQYGVS